MNKLSLFTVLKVPLSVGFSVVFTQHVRARVNETAFRKSEICW